MRTLPTLVAAAAAVASCLVAALATVPAALAVPIAGTGGTGSDGNGLVATSPGEPIEVVRTVTETVGVGVPYLTAVAIGLLAFAAAWILATFVASHRTHHATEV